jgi:transposase
VGARAGSGPQEPGGYVFGALIPATGEALTATYTSRSIATFLDFLEKVEAWVPKSVRRIYAIMDNLRAHKSYDVLLFSLAHPRWEFVFQLKYAAYLNLIEPWWKTLRSLAIKGRFFESWEQIEEAVARAVDYWNEHRHGTCGVGAGDTAHPAGRALVRCRRYPRSEAESVWNIADEPDAIPTPIKTLQERCERHQY